MDYGVTGTHRLLSEAEAAYVRRVTKRTLIPCKTRGVPSPRAGKFPHKLISGAAHGVDSECVLAVWGLIPFEAIYFTVPGTAQHNYGLVDRAVAQGAHVIKCPTLHTARETYLARDDKTVELLQILLAFPKRDTFYRSGTWATINRARRAGRKVRMYPLVNA